ncbi:MAG: discoidin domain-containing protein [Phycisphaerales bacterium]|nr:discoidin domain-containing protein [Phycisphaerales bacterium]
MRMFRLTTVVALTWGLGPRPCAAIPDADGLLAWQLSEFAGEDTIGQLQASADGRAFLDELESDPEWLHELFDSGPTKHPEIVIPFLFELWREDLGLADHQVHRSMATATALSLGMSGSADNSEVYADRYRWFRDSWNDELLNAGYGDLSTFERRFLASGLQWKNMTTIEALDYLRDQVQVPRSRYSGTAWYAPYRGQNAFGDSVQGPMYYMPFDGSYDSSPEMAMHVGGVCGALSHVGAASALASGIPALTMGEPGHCAYAVQTKPHVWQPCYSLSWKRGLHTNVVRSNWSALVMAQQAMDDEVAMRRAGDQLRRAAWYEAEGRPAKANAALMAACRAQPLSEEVWARAARFGTRHEMNGAWWRQLQGTLVQSLMPDHPEPAWHIMRGHLIPALLKDRDAIEVLNPWLQNLKGWGPVRWHIERVFDWAWAQADSSAGRAQLLEDLLERVIDDPSTGPPFVAWAQGKIEGDPELAERFETVLLAQSGRKGEGREAVLRQLARTMLPAAAQNRDLETFQRIGRRASSLFEPRPTLEELKVEAFPGELLSSGGALRIFKPGNRWDSPEQHWGVLEHHGGFFHTDNGKTPWFEVELPGYGDLSGIVLEARGGHPARVKGVRVLVSEDGSNWKQVGVTTSGRVHQRIDLTDSTPRARFIRFERDGQCLHYHRILVFGRRAS